MNKSEMDNNFGFRMNLELKPKRQTNIVKYFAHKANNSSTSQCQYSPIIYMVYYHALLSLFLTLNLTDKKS